MLDDPENTPAFMAITKIENIEAVDKESVNIDNDDLPILPTRNLVLFPQVTAPVGITRKKSLYLAQECSRRGTILGVICQKDSEKEDPELKDLEKYGVYARIINVITLPNGSHTAIIQALGKFRVIGAGEGRFLSENYIAANVKPIKDVEPKGEDKEFQAMVNGVRESALKIIGKSSEGLGFELGINLRNIDDSELIVNSVATMFPLDHAVKTHLLTLHRLKERAFELLAELTRQEQMVDLTELIRDKARKGMEEHQKEAFLHEQMEAIRDELYGDEAGDYENLLKRVEEKKLTERVESALNKEFDKLRRLNPNSPEYSVQYNYLDLLLSLPWENYSNETTNLTDAERELESGHYGMEKVKERILEQLAVILNSPDVKSPIICLVGPPGVGKTSIARSVAKALGREYQRISLGGLHDEAEIRGHRRTYIGAMPGRIMDAMKRVKTGNPVLVLDEIDKLGADYKGDPSSALLEVLDPEQNSHFHDNFIDIDYDLSKVMFIATANTLSTLPQPLLDRMEVIELSGYAEEEKIEIARRHLIEKVKTDMKYSTDVDITFDALRAIISEYTSESGVRQLEKTIASLLRKHLKKSMQNKSVENVISDREVREYLGKPRYSRERYETNEYPGVVTGLAWTSVGGEILFVESSLIPGKGDKLTLTGNLGDVMKESATLAVQYVKANAKLLEIDDDIFEKNNIHIHVPEGAVPKDGPSAGITLVTSIVSALKNVKVKEKLAMTGEITLRGKVLPVGGIKEKLLAARRAGIKTVLMSEENRKDVEEIPNMYLKDITVRYVKDIDDVLSNALLTEKS